MNEPGEAVHDSAVPPGGACDAETAADARMAEILRGRAEGRRRLRDALAGERTPESDDLLGRLNALEFVDAVVGEVSDIPERLADYRITGLLGRGGMGTVYAAFQETLEREVALKVLSPAFSADPTMRARFRTEARATASLHHAHIVPIYDFGEAAGMLFFAMERVDGVSLDKHIAAARRYGRPTMAPREAAARFAGVAEALDHAHRRRVMHRDVKPGNLLVGPDGTLALADFGLSKILGEVSVSARLTAGGAFLGTLAYAAPEQARGEAASPASDLYALGVTMFEAVAGELPRCGSSPEAMLDAVLNGRPRRLREVLHRPPKDLEAVLDKLLQRDAADRYADGGELARDLRRIADGEPVRIRRQPVWVRAWRTVRRRPDLWSMVAIAVLLAVVAVGLGVVNRRVRQSSASLQHDNELQLAVAAVARQAGPAAGPPGLLASLLGVDVAVGEPASPDVVLEHLDRARQLLPGDPKAEHLRAAYLDDPLPEATALLRQGHGYRAALLLDQAIQAADKGWVERDEVTWLRMYRFYLARAAASLGGAVAQVDEARRNLFAATLIRSGAFFPKLLLAFVEWSPAQGAGALVPRVRELVRDGPPGAPRVAGLLLGAFSGARRAAGCNLLGLEVPYSVRRDMVTAAAELLPEGGLPGTSSAWTGLESALASAARGARQVLGDAPSMAPELERARRILREEVHPASPLQSWGFVLDVLGNQLSPARAGASLPPDLQVRAWRDLLRLQLPRVLVESAAEHIEGLVKGRRDPAALELSARLASALGLVPSLLAAADAWYQVEPDAPGPLLSRFEGFVLAGEVTEAACCGAQLLQIALDAGEAKRELVRVLRSAEQGGAPRAADWARLRQQFEQFEQFEELEPLAPPSGAAQRVRQTGG